jgi:hypothetical protein
MTRQWIKVGGHFVDKISAGNYEVHRGGALVRVQKRRSGWAMIRHGNAIGSRDTLVDAINDAVQSVDRELTRKPDKGVDS